MMLDEAIRFALVFEKKVRDHYAEAAKKSQDPAGKKFFGLLAREEEGHVDYLEHKLQEWREQGKLGDDALPTVIPRSDWVVEGLDKLKTSGETRNYTDDLERLYTALKLEDDATAHYKRLVAELPGEGKALFQRFLDIEEGHTALVQTEIDVATKTGFFYDFQEFNLEE